MKLQVLSFSKGYFSWTWKVDPSAVQDGVSAWLKANPGTVIHEIRHDAFASFWHPQQLLVSIYYDDPA